MRDRMGERERPWRDKETLAEYWYDESITLEEISDEFGCGEVTIHRWVERFGLERRQSHGGPWEDGELLFDLYWNEKLTQSEIADRFDCQQPTIHRWMEKHDIPARYTSKKYGTLTTFSRDGHTYFCVDCEMVWMHRLLAVAEYGFDEVVGKQVHHENGVPWDNRRENIVPLTDAEHMEEHREELVKARHG